MITKLIESSRKSGDWSKLAKYFEEHQELPYAEKNASFITSSKIKEFARCPFCYSKRYVDMMPCPGDTSFDKDYFVIGRAFDDLVTLGGPGFEQKYEVVARRAKEAEKVQLTERMGRLIDQMAAEFNSNELFAKEPIKKVMFMPFPFNTEIVKVEVDDFDSKNKVIRDVKTCANIKLINPIDYIIQASLYQLVAEYHMGETYDVEYEFVDKNDHFSRSQKVIFSNETLHRERDRIFQIIQDMHQAHQSGIYLEAEDQYVLFDCPYYGVDGHGRPKQPIII
jgi:hypothetical protein